MTRDTVTVNGETVADVYHNHEEDHPHCVIQIGDVKIPFDGEDDYVDVKIDGSVRDGVLDLSRDDRDFWSVFQVREEGTTVSAGLTAVRSTSPIEIVTGGTSHLVIPSNQRVTIDLYGEPVDGGDGQ